MFGIWKNGKRPSVWFLFGKAVFILMLIAASWVAYKHDDFFAKTIVWALIVKECVEMSYDWRTGVAVKWPARK